MGTTASKMGLAVVDTTSNDDSQLRCRETVLVSGLTVDNSELDFRVEDGGDWFEGFKGFVGFV